MHIRKILIENIRCFDRVELDLTRPDGSLAGWTVLAGRNGTGKSTLLKAIALAVAGPEVARSLQKSFVDWVRTSQRKAQITTELECSVGDWIGDDEAWREERTHFWTGLSWETSSGDGEPFLWTPQDVVLLVPSLSEYPPDPHQYRGPWHNNPSGWFIAAYGPLRRLGFRDDYKQPGPQMQAGLASLFDEDVTLAESIHWLKDIHAIRLDLQDRASRTSEAEAKTLLDDARKHALVYENVLSLLNDGLLPPGSSVVSLDMQRGLLVKQDGVTLALRSLSDGYRAALALVFDIVRQMYRCFGERLEISRREVDGKHVVQVEHQGIVLIDEVDAHLHVSWQQRIGFWLKEHFPNVQFIVTTHSPFVCQAADPKGLIRLPTPGSGERVEHVSDDLYNTAVYGDVDDAVMTALFGLERAHSDHAEALRSRVAKLQAKMMRGHATPDEKEEMYRLSARLPKTGSALVQQTLRKLGDPG
ncbi:AAA family ATPase [Polyangium fumosum]|nr:AAA family ATPase [Polyangium fumosum]